MISIVKDDIHKRFIWIMVKGSHSPLYIAGCYIPHRESPFYQRHEVDPSQPLGDLCLDIAMFSKQGNVLLIGDFNARIGDLQFQYLTQQEYIKDYEIETDPIWCRCSEDKEVNAHGRALKQLMNRMHKLVVNGTALFPKSNSPTCFPASGGTSVIDYELIGLEACHLIHNFSLGSKSPD